MASRDLPDSRTDKCKISIMIVIIIILIPLPHSGAPLMMSGHSVNKNSRNTVKSENILEARLDRSTNHEKLR